jgi:hypothetical protein
MEDEPKPDDLSEAPIPPITPEDVDEHGLIIRENGELRFWLSGSENPRVYDYRAERFLTNEEAAHELSNLSLDNKDHKELEE